MKVLEIARRVGGTVQGDGELEIVGVCSIDDAKPGCVAFLDSKKYLTKLLKSSASAVLTATALETDKAQIITPGPKLAFAKLLEEFFPQPCPEPGIDSRASLGENISIGNGVKIYEFASIGDGSIIGDNTVVYPGSVVGKNCNIGSDCVLHANVTLYPGAELGNRVVLHSGSVIGADGFGYTMDEKGHHFKIRQVGNVTIEDDVEVGANSCIDRAAIGETRIKRGTKIDNLVQIAHNCSIGEHSVIVAQAGIAGSAVLGRYVVLAGQVGVGDHVTLGDKVTLASRTAAFRDIESGEVHGGFPSVPINIWKKYALQLPKLPELLKRVRRLEKRIHEIENEKSK
tara:strand:- start:2741 stop:3766 length:1026 start_codon:yes stop_codon:yes gene_type:complete